MKRFKKCSIFLIFSDNLQKKLVLEVEVTNEYLKLGEDGTGIASVSDAAA